MHFTDLTQSVSKIKRKINTFIVEHNQIYYVNSVKFKFIENDNEKKTRKKQNDKI